MVWDTLFCRNRLKFFYSIHLTFEDDLLQASLSGHEENTVFSAILHMVTHGSVAVVRAYQLYSVRKFYGQYISCKYDNSATCYASYMYISVPFYLTSASFWVSLPLSNIFSVCLLLHTLLPAPAVRMLPFQYYHIGVILKIPFLQVK